MLGKMTKRLLIVFILLISGLINSVFATVTSKDVIEFYSDNNTEEVVKLLSQIPDTEKSALDFLLLGNIYEENGDYNSAISCYKNSIIKDKKFSRAYYNLGYVYASQRDYIKALTYYNTALEYQPENPYIMYNIGCMNLKLSNVKKANKDFTKAINKKSDVSLFYYNLAYTYKLMGDKKLSEDCIDRYNKLKAEGK